MECSQTRDACIASPPDDDDSPDDMDSCDLNDADAQSCTATVAEIEACTKAQIAEFKSQIQGVSCDTLTISDENDDGDDGDDGEPALPPACQTVEQKCPSLFEDDTTPTDPPPAE